MRGGTVVGAEQYRTNSPGTKSPDDVVIVSALRTPICKAKRGGFKDTRVEDLLGTVFKASLDRTGVDGSDVRLPACPDWPSPLLTQLTL